MSKEIEVMESVFKRNDDLAVEINRKLTDERIFAVNILGAPGVGKTSSVINLIKQIPFKSYVVEGDIESDIDTKKLLSLGIETVQINTGGGCHLNSTQVEKALEELKPERGIVFIENIGNLVCPADFLIGEHVKLLISCITEGSDKPYKYPLAFEKADILLINKIDLLDHIDFDEDYFMEGVRRLNPNLPVFKVSCKTESGFDEAAKWITKKADEVINKLT